jgi:hypothetical protein
MKTFEAILSSTVVDQHGEVMSKGALESAANILSKNYVQMGVEHDPRHPPIGRFTEAWVEEQSDGVIVLKGRGELFEPEDELPNSIGKTIIEREYPEGHLQLTFDRSYNSDEDHADINAIANRFGSKPRQEIKKAVEPLSILAIGGAFVFGAIASGFLGQIGADTYTFLKDKLVALIKRQRGKSKDQLLVFDFTVTHKGQKLLVQAILSNPTDEQIDTFLKQAIYDLDSAIGSDAFSPKLQLSRLVYLYENQSLEFLYAVRKDGFPVTYKKKKTGQGTLCGRKLRPHRDGRERYEQRNAVTH